MSTTQEAMEVSTFFEDTTATKMQNTNTDNKRVGFVEGEYLGHITNARTIVRPVRDTYKARIYNFDIMVAEEHSQMKHQYEAIDGKHVEVSGEQFVGRKLIAKGIFKFLDPQEGDDFEGNPTDNKRYFEFCELLGLKPTEETRTIDGKETKVKILPLLEVEHMNGKPVTAVLKKVKDSWVNKNGEKMHYSWRVTYVKPWTTGTAKKMEVNLDDLPF
tara:strand:+ start:779 stop:1426 length:648 start_codon:yes stop_codon:yes gene_type:complete